MKNSEKKWQQIANKELDNKCINDLTKISTEGIKIKPLYTVNDLPEYQSKSEEFPGISPYKRGPKATMYANKPWTIRQYSGFSTAKESNEFYRKKLKSGQKGLSIAFDLPTHRGYDSDNKNMLGDVGKAGVAIDSVEDMKILLKDIDLEKISVSMTMNGAILPVFASFIVAAEESGVHISKLRGTIQNDILKEFLVRNTFIYPPKESMRIIGDIMKYNIKNIPNFNSISISGYHMHEAGADASLELALTLANGLEYVKNALSHNLKIDDFAPRLSFFFALGMNFYTEIAKLRAARILWNNIIEKFSPKNSASKILRTHCQTSGWSLQAKNPYNNIIRTTIEAMSGIFGGTQSLHTNSFDEALALPTDFSSNIALNTQLILQEESGITNVIDPFGGSYLIERLTYDLLSKAEKIMEKIKSLGGMTNAIIDGYPKELIEISAARKQANIDNNIDTIIGVNKHISNNHEKIDLRHIDNNKVNHEQLEQIKILKNKRNKKEVKRKLLILKDGAKNNKNLLKLTINAIRARATIGEVSYSLEKVFGRHKQNTKLISGIYIKTYKNTALINELTKKIKNFSKKHGRQPRILIAKLGQDGHDRGARVVATAFADFGFDVDLSPLFQTPSDVVKNAIENDVHIIGISTLAGSHNILIPELIDILRQKKASDIIITLGGVIPSHDHDELYKKGVSCIFGPGTKVIDAANKIFHLINL